METIIFEGNSSQITQIKTYFAGVLTALISTALYLLNVPDIWKYMLGGYGISLLIFLYGYLKLKTVRYRITSKSITVKKGILSTSESHFLLENIKEITVSQPILLRILGIGHIYITSAGTDKEILRGIQNVNKIKESIFEHMKNYNRQ